MTTNPDNVNPSPAPTHRRTPPSVLALQILAFVVLLLVDACVPVVSVFFFLGSGGCDSQLNCTSHTENAAFWLPIAVAAWGLVVAAIGLVGRNVGRSGAILTGWAATLAGLLVGFLMTVGG